MQKGAATFGAAGKDGVQGEIRLLVGAILYSVELFQKTPPLKTLKSLYLSGGQHSSEYLPLMHLSPLAVSASFPQLDVERKTARLARNGHFFSQK